MKKILIVDDSEEIRDLVTMTLRRADRHVIQAKTGEEAVELARREKPDLIMMDIMMPGPVDGLEATRALKGDVRTKDCKVIFLTAKGQTEDLEEGFEAGADDYFVKPFSPLALMKKVDALIGG
ncbi:MAG: response regulator [Desulfomonile tiedjei]|nr:response regulator [Desulfomonile tiedjei]